MNFKGSNSLIVPGRTTIGFLPATNMLIGKPSFWQKHGTKIKTFLVAAFVLSVLLSVFEYQMSRPMMDVNSRDQAVRIRFEDGRVLNPGDPGFNEARKIARRNWVQ
jgi:hypothetical protein